MRRNNHLVLLLNAFFVFSACSQNKQTSASQATPIQSNQSDHKLDTHNSSNSLDCNGTYVGIVPCADCEGIKTELTLNQDKTYSLKTSYVGKGDKSFEENGTFTWNDAGNTITLSGITSRPNQYFVGENKIIQLDMTGNRITGNLSENYILKKQ